MVWCQMVERKMPLTMSAAPATVKQASTAQVLVDSPASATEPPQTAAATTTARPWAWTREVHPEVAVARRLPTVPAVSSRP